MPAPSSKFGAVRPDNVRTKPAARRDPDADIPAPPASTAPTGPGPTDPTPPPVPAPAVPEAPVRVAPPPVNPGAAPQPRSAVAPAGGGTLASVLTAPHHQTHSVSEGVAALAGLAGLAARPTDPMEDWAGDGTRTPRWLAAAVRQYAMLTGRKTQEVQRDALLNVRPIPDDVLDAQWLHHYGYPREQYNPEAYR